MLRARICEFAESARASSETTSPRILLNAETAPVQIVTYRAVAKRLLAVHATPAHVDTRQVYERLVDAEVLGHDDRVGLLGGEIVVQGPQHGPHATHLRSASPPIYCHAPAASARRPPARMALGAVTAARRLRRGACGS